MPIHLKHLLNVKMPAVKDFFSSSFIRSFVDFRCSDRKRMTIEKKKKKQMALSAVKQMTLSCRNEKASHIENFQCDSSKIDDEERSGTIGKKTFSITLTDVEDE